MTILSSSFTQALLPLAVKYFGQAYPQWKTLHEQVCKVIKSDRRFEKDVLASGLTYAPVVAEASGIPYQDIAEGGQKVYTHVKYGTGIKISREAVEFDQVKIITDMRTKSLKKAMLQTRDAAVANAVFNRAFDETNYPTFDGKAVCSATHPLRDGSVLNNLGAADFSESAFESAIIQIKGWKEDSGLLCMLKPQKIVINPANEFEVQRVLGNKDRPATSDRDINASKSLGYADLDIIISPRITDLDSWYLLMDVDSGIKFYQARDIEFSNDEDISVEVSRFLSTMMFSAGVSDFRAMYGNQGS